MYILAKKHKNKWYGVAGCGAKGCLAEAEKFFANNGFSAHPENAFRRDLVVHYRKNLESQKNYAGILPEFKQFD